MRVLNMSWLDLAFLHWPVPSAELRPLVPSELEIETFDGKAWVGIVPFEMRHVRLRGLPPIPSAHNFPELNVRTYVRHCDRQGVYFFSLDAGSLLAVTGARASTGLPYFHARMRMSRDARGVSYESRRTVAGAREARLNASYLATGPVFTSEPGSFDHWCTERYSLFSRHLGALLRLDIRHPRWPLQRATAQISVNSMASAAGISLPSREPHVLFAKRVDVIASVPRRVS